MNTTIGDWIGDLKRYAPLIVIPTSRLRSESRLHGRALTLVVGRYRADRPHAEHCDDEKRTKSPKRLWEKSSAQFRLIASTPPRPLLFTICFYECPSFARCSAGARIASMLRCR